MALHVGLEEIDRGKAPEHAAGGVRGVAAYFNPSTRYSSESTRV